MAGRKKSPPKRKTGERERQELNRVFRGGLSVPALMVVILFIAAFLYGSYLEKGNTEEPAAVVSNFIERDADLSIRYIDVGQGDCELISYAGQNILIDAGEKEAAEAVIGALDELGITRLDYVIATHPHADHIGAMYKVIEKYDIGTVIAPRVKDELVPTSKAYERFLTALSKKGQKLTAAKPGTVYSLADEDKENDNTAFEVLSPVGNDYDDLNDWSVVIRLVHGNCAFLFTGDAERAAESDIIASGAELSADVLKVGHHGSSTSSSKKFLEAVSPKAAVISCGDGNSFGHPHKDTIEKLEKRNIEYYRTDQCGTVTVYSDGESFRVQTERSDGGASKKENKE